jgi:hypothetical protein
MEKQNPLAPFSGASVDGKLGKPIVQILTSEQATEWDAFVRHTEGGTFFHLAGWRKIFETIFGFKTHFLVAQKGKEITGVLPLVHQRSLLFGNALIAAPFCVEGGPLASDSESREALDGAAISLMKECGASYIEFRSREARHPGWVAKKDLYATFSRALTSKDEENLLARHCRAR